MKTKLCLAALIAACICLFAVLPAQAQQNESSCQALYNRYKALKECSADWPELKANLEACAKPDIEIVRALENLSEPVGPMSPRFSLAQEEGLCAEICEQSGGKWWKGRCKPPKGKRLHSRCLVVNGKPTKKSKQKDPYAHLSDVWFEAGPCVVARYYPEEQDPDSPCHEGFLGVNPRAHFVALLRHKPAFVGVEFGLRGQKRCWICPSGCSTLGSKCMSRNEMILAGLCMVTRNPSGYSLYIPEGEPNSGRVRIIPPDFGPEFGREPNARFSDPDFQRKLEERRNSK